MEENQSLVFDGNSGIAMPAGNILNIIGDGKNITTKAHGNTITIYISDSYSLNALDSKKISLPKTNPGGSEGVVYKGDSIFMHDHSVGAPSLYVGSNSGNPMLPSQSNIGLGIDCLSQANNANFNVALGKSLSKLVNGNFNVACGIGSLANSVSSTGNVALGAQAGAHLNSSYFNTLIGTNAGINYSSSESYNVVVGSSAGQADESYVVRIGNDGSAPAVPSSQKAFIYGISGNTIKNAQPVYIDMKTGQLGTQSECPKAKICIKEVSSSSENIYRLNAVSYKYKSDEDEVLHYGFIPEDVQRALPELVQGDHVRSIEMIALLVNEIQKLKKQVDELTPLARRVGLLESQIK